MLPVVLSRHTFINMQTPAIHLKNPVHIQAAITTCRTQWCPNTITCIIDPKVMVKQKWKFSNSRLEVSTLEFTIVNYPGSSTILKCTSEADIFGGIQKRVFAVYTLATCLSNS
jgi:hypothetical protein